MTEFQQKTSEVLSKAADYLSRYNSTVEISAEIRRLAESVEQPCVVAVVGPVKSGKSTFINAFLGEDLAKTGTTETTATINYFRYGTPNKEKPVRCYWRSGNVTKEDFDFLNSLQGKDIETLRRADGIKYLEYLIPNSKLRKITLVDTPGTGAVVDEHQNTTAEYLKLSRQLRERHHNETQRIENEADAVIYLIEAVARAENKEFLDEFLAVTGGQSRAFNALGVMGKIDIDSALIQKKNKLAAKISDQLKNSLNTVIPVSAGLRRCLDILQEKDQLKVLIKNLRLIPPETSDLMLQNEEIFLSIAEDDCLLTKRERQNLRTLGGNPPWAVFKTIAETIINPAKTDASIIEELDGIAGFKLLLKTLKQTFFMRGDILRCYRIITDARRQLNKIKFSILPEICQRESENNTKLQRFSEFIEHSTNSDESVKKELLDFLKTKLETKNKADEIEKLRRFLDGELSKLFHELVDYNADFGALRQLDENPEKFSQDEIEELRRLFGLYGLEIEERILPENLHEEFVRKSQLRWKGVEATSPIRSPRKSIAAHAQVRYGLAMESLIINSEYETAGEYLKKTNQIVESKYE